MKKPLESDEIRLAGVAEQSMEANGIGLRKVYFSQGCNHHCAKCFSPETWSFTQGKIYKISELIKQLKIDAAYLDGITLSGGDPIEQYEKFMPLVKETLKLKLNVWCWTGYTWEELMIKVKKDPALLDFLKMIDVLVDGRFVYSLRDNNDPDGSHKWRGSKNQRVIDVQKTLKNKRVITLIK